MGGAAKDHMARAVLRNSANDASNAGTRARVRTRSLPFVVDVAVLTTVLLVGFWLRQRMLLEAPPFTDETEEIARALQIARGQSLPLTSVNGFISAWNSYLTAGAFGLFGPS